MNLRFHLNQHLLDQNSEHKHSYRHCIEHHYNLNSDLDNHLNHYLLHIEIHLHRNQFYKRIETIESNNNNKKQNQFPSFRLIFSNLIFALLEILLRVCIQRSHHKLFHLHKFQVKHHNQLLCYI